MHGTWLTRSLAVAMVLAPGSALAQERAWDWQWGGHPMMWMWGAGGLVMMLMMLMFWGVVIAALVVGVRWLIGQGHPARRDEALEILRQRYARGEIDKQELEITIDDDGNVTIKVVGVAGPDCLKLTKDIEEALGIVVDRQRTNDFYVEKPKVNEQIDQGR